MQKSVSPFPESTFETNTNKNNRSMLSTKLLTESGTTFAKLLTRHISLQSLMTNTTSFPPIFQLYSLFSSSISLGEPHAYERMGSSSSLVCVCDIHFLWAWRPSSGEFWMRFGGRDGAGDESMCTVYLRSRVCGIRKREIRYESMTYMITRGCYTP
jgi:hypothetical protein